MWPKPKGEVRCDLTEGGEGGEWYRWKTWRRSVKTWHHLKERPGLLLAQRKEAAPPGKENALLRVEGLPSSSVQVQWRRPTSTHPSLGPSYPRSNSSSLTCKEFITPLASTAIFPATDLTPCLNWAMSAVGSTFPRYTLPVKARKRVI